MHTPVLLKEVIAALNPQPGEFFIDGTFGGGGHARAILEKIGSAGKLLAVDWNETAARQCQVMFAGNDAPQIVCAQGNFANLPAILEKRGLAPADGLLIDLGVSSDEMENSGRGFSFQKDEPLLMTYSDSQTPARELLRRISESQLADIIHQYSQERWAGRIARVIVAARRQAPIRTSRQLAEIVTGAVPRQYERGRLHPATRTFMALRIYINQELENLAAVLDNLDQIIRPGGRAAIISFHSLEDRLVKQRFRKRQLITKKPIIASAAEIAENPRARSAKLRAAVINPLP